MRDTKHVAMNAKQQKELEAIVKGLCKEHDTTVVADLESRLSFREKDPKDPKAASWSAYSRLLCADGHTIYVSLRSPMKASYSKNIDKFAQAKVSKREKRQEKAEARKAARLQKEEETAAAKETKGFEKTAAKVKNPKADRKVPVVPFDKDLPTLEGTVGRQVKSKKSKRAPVQEQATDTK